MALAGVDDQYAVRARRREHGAARPDRRLQPRHVVAERGAEAAGLEEIALHVDDDKRAMRKVDGKRRRLGGEFHGVADGIHGACVQ